MAYPTINEIFTAAPSAGGRPTLVLMEVLYIMRKYLPDVLTRVNTRENLDIPLPQNYGFAGASLGHKYPILTVGMASSRSELGLRVNQDDNHITVNYLYDQIASPRQVLDAIEACNWIGNIMHKFVGTHNNADGMRVWNQLKPGGIVAVVFDKGNTEGFAYQFQAWQPGQKGYYSDTLINP